MSAGRQGVAEAAGLLSPAACSRQPNPCRSLSKARVEWTHKSSARKTHNNSKPVTKPKLGQKKKEHLRCDQPRFQQQASVYDQAWSLFATQNVLPSDGVAEAQHAPWDAKSTSRSHSTPTSPGPAVATQLFRSSCNTTQCHDTVTPKIRDARASVAEDTNVAARQEVRQFCKSPEIVQDKVECSITVDLQYPA